MKKHNNVYYSIGRKIPPEYENPIDNILLDLCEEAISICKRFKITPNAITLFRILIGILTIYNFNFSCNYFYPITGTAIFYWFDCLDGHLARSTNQVTVLGDYLDHYADICFFISLLASMFIKKYTNKLIICIIIICISYLSFIHLGLQQKNYKHIKEEIRQENLITKDHEKVIILDEIDDELLDNLNNLHSLEAYNIKWSKYFGTGTMYTILIGIIYYIQTNNNCINIV